MTHLAYYTNRSVLITGGLGFIGSNLARRLVDLGAQVTVVDSLISDYGGNRFNLAGYEERLHINIADVRDPYSMRALVQGHLDGVLPRLVQLGRLPPVHRGGQGQGMAGRLRHQDDGPWRGSAQRRFGGTSKSRPWHLGPRSWELGPHSWAAAT